MDEASTVAPPESDGDQHYGQHGPKRRIWPWIVGLLVLGIALWIGVREYLGSHAANTKPKGPPTAPVVAALAHQGDIPVFFTGLGAVTPIYTITIKTRVDGEIMKVLYTEGQMVAKDQALVEIDPRPFQVQLTQAEGQLIKDKAALDNAQIDLKRYEDLIKKNAVAQQIYATQKSTVAQDEGNVKTDEGNIASAKLNISYSHITAPIGGRVGLRLVDPGNLVTAAGATPLVVITQTTPISVIFTLPEEQVPAVVKHMRDGEHLLVDALDRDSQNVIAHGQLTTLDNQIDQTTGTLRFRATFPNKDGALFPNQFVNARLLLVEKKSVTLVPNAAVQRNGNSTFVYVVQPDNTVTVRTVTVGTTTAEESEIKTGVAPGEVVITQGVDKLQEGVKVQAQIQGQGSRAATPSPGANDKGNTAPQAPGSADHKKRGSSSKNNTGQNP